MIRRHVWAALASLTVVACASAAVPPVAHAASLDFKVTNYDNDNTTGVYLRTSSNVNAKTSTLLTYGTGIHLDCELSGSAVGPNNNTIWDHVTVTTGSAKGKTGYLSDHWINTPVGGASGEPKCSSGTSVGSKAIAWARGHLGQSYMSGLCLGFAMRAYSSAGVDIGGASSAAAYWTNNPRNYTRHTNTSPAVGALVGERRRATAPGT